MSWQTYIDDHLMVLPSGNQLKSAAIIGNDGSVWAQSPEFPQLKDAEFKAILNGFTDSNSIAQHGLFMAGNKYMVVAGQEGEAIRGKKGSGGVCVKKLGTALVVGVYEEPTQPGEVNLVVEGLGDYLISMGI